MEILYITPSPPNELSRIRALNTIKSFKAKGYRVTLATLYNHDNFDDIKKYNKYYDDVIAVYQPKILSVIYALISLILPIPASVGYAFSFKLRNKLKRTKLYDIVYIKRLRMASYRSVARGKKVYIDITDSMEKYNHRIIKETKGIKKLVALEEYYKLTSYERKLCLNNNVTICSSEDKSYIEDKVNKKLDNLIVLPNTIDVDYWYQDVKVKSAGSRKELVFFGIMDYEPNVLAMEYFIKEVMPLLNNNYHLTIIGKNPSEKITKLTAQNKNIKIMGYIEDIKLELSKYDIFICPIVAGAGVKNKLLQAICMGLPVVSSPLGVEGVQSEIVNNIFVAQNADQYLDYFSKINNMNTQELKNMLHEQQMLVKKYYYNLECTNVLFGDVENV